MRWFQELQELFSVCDVHRDGVDSFFGNFSMLYLLIYFFLTCVLAQALMIWELFQGNVTKEGEVRSDLFLSTQTLNFLSLYLKVVK